MWLLIAVGHAVLLPLTLQLPTALFRFSKTRQKWLKMAPDIKPQIYREGDKLLLKVDGMQVWWSCVTVTPL